jgi:hypothetical protein
MTDGENQKIFLENLFSSFASSHYYLSVRDGPNNYETSPTVDMLQLRGFFTIERHQLIQSYELDSIDSTRRGQQGTSVNKHDTA